MMIGLSNRDLKALSTLTTRSQHLVNRDSMNMPELDLTNMHGLVSQLILRAPSDTRCAGAHSIRRRGWGGAPFGSSLKEQRLSYTVTTVHLKSKNTVCDDSLGGHQTQTRVQATIAGQDVAECTMSMSH